MKHYTNKHFFHILFHFTVNNRGNASPLPPAEELTGGKYQQTATTLAHRLN